MKYVLIPVYSARSHSELNIKVSMLDQLKKWYDLDIQENQPTYFISYTDINKIGLNPQFRYHNPLGVYCYPVRTIYERVTNDTVPFASDRPFIQVVKRTTEQVLDDGYTKGQYERDKQRLEKLFNTIDKSSLPNRFSGLLNYIKRRYHKSIEESEDITFQSLLSISNSLAKSNSDINNTECKQIFYIWSLTQCLAILIDEKKNPFIWNAILRKNLQYELVVDNGLGYIHHHEYTQAVFLITSAYKQVDTILTKKEEVREKHVTIDGKNYDVNRLPNGLSVNGDLDVSYTSIIKLPDNLTIKGKLIAKDTNINLLPKNLKVGGSIILSESKITKLPDNLTVAGDLNIAFTKIRKLPNNLTVKGDLDLSGSDITDFSPAPRVTGDIDLSYTEKLRTMDDGLVVNGDMRLYKSHIDTLPNRLTVEGDLDAEHSYIDKLPKDLKVEGRITTSIKQKIDGKIFNINSLPKGLVVKNSLYLEDTPLKHLPDNLTVNGNLNISNTRLTKLPNNLTVKGDLIFHLNYKEANKINVPNSIKVDGDIESWFIKKIDNKIYNICKLPNGLTVPCDLIIEDTKRETNQYYITLPEDLTVNNDLVLCNSHIQFSNNCTVKNDLHLEYAEVKFAKSLSVNGNMYIKGSNITRIPPGVKVGGKIIGK